MTWTPIERYFVHLSRTVHSAAHRRVALRADRRDRRLHRRYYVNAVLLNSCEPAYHTHLYVCGGACYRHELKIGLVDVFARHPRRVHHLLRHPVLIVRSSCISLDDDDDRSDRANL